MGYQRISSRVQGEHFFTTIKFDCMDTPVEIPHFMSDSLDDIIFNIEEREKSELAKIEAEQKNNIIKQQFDLIIN